MTYSYRTIRPLPGFERGDRCKLGVTTLPGEDGMCFEVAIDTASREAATEYLTAKSEPRSTRNEIFTADDMRPAS